MRSLALLLMLANIVLFAWQKSMLPWFPWQPPSSASTQNAYFPPSDLPQLVLLSEQAEKTAESEITQAPTTEVEKTVVAKAEIPIAEKSESKLENDQKSDNLDNIESKPIENTDNIVAKIEPPMTMAEEAIFENEKNDKELIDQEFETKESILEEIETAALNEGEVAGNDNTEFDVENVSKDSNSHTENVMTLVEKDSDITEETPNFQEFDKPEKENVFFKAFANFYENLMATTISFLNAPIDESGKTVVKVGTNDANIIATAPIETSPVSVRNKEEPEKIENSALAEKVVDIQENTAKSENSEKIGDTQAKPSDSDSVDSAQIIDSSDDLSDSKNMTALAKNATISIETPQEVENTEKNKADNIAKSESPSSDNTKSESAPSQSLCFQIGPYARSNSAKTAMNWFTKQKVNVKMQQRKTSILESTWVYLPPFHNKRTALRTQGLLTRYGIKDHALATWKKQPNAVSLGLFRDPINAELRVKELKKKGFFNVQSEKRYKNDTKHWLSVKMLENQSILIDSFRKKFKTANLKSATCD